MLIDVNRDLAVGSSDVYKNYSIFLCTNTSYGEKIRNNDDEFFIVNIQAWSIFWTIYYCVIYIFTLLKIQLKKLFLLLNEKIKLFLVLLQPTGDNHFIGLYPPIISSVPFTLIIVMVIVYCHTMCETFQE
jgi:hypothetical protein